jgi:hypothetical protein
MLHLYVIICGAGNPFRSDDNPAMHFVANFDLDLIVAYSTKQSGKLDFFYMTLNSFSFWNPRRSVSQKYLRYIIFNGRLGGCST